jgi:hypothetical protein
MEDTDLVTFNVVHPDRPTEIVVSDARTWPGLEAEGFTKVEAPAKKGKA